MYSAGLRTTDRSGAVAAALAIQIGLIAALLSISGKMDRSETEAPLSLVDLPVKVDPPARPRLQAKKTRNGGTAPKNLKSAGSSIVVPRTQIDLPQKTMLPAVVTAGQEPHLADGQANVRGQGNGMGGSGAGSGEGNGGGSGEIGGVMEPPHLVTPVLSTSDFPREILREWPRNVTIFLRLKINAEGYVSECLLDRGTNLSAIDSQMCNMAHERLRFQPALNHSGQPVAGWFGYAQPAPR